MLTWLSIPSLPSGSYTPNRPNGRDCWKNGKAETPGVLALWRRIMIWMNDDADDEMIYGLKFYAIYPGGVTAAWMCIGFSSACATLISYTTPTVGLGCRSFNFTLYAILSLVIAWLSVLRHWLCHRSRSKPTTTTTINPHQRPASSRGFS